MKFNTVLLMGVLACSSSVYAQENSSKKDSLTFEGEKHFKNIRQLTFGGDNAEAYFSLDGKAISFQRAAPKDGVPCDQIFYGILPESAKEKFNYKLVST